MGEGGGGRQKGSLQVFPMQLLQTQEIALKIFGLLVLTVSPQCCRYSRPYPVPLLNYWTWNKITSQKKSFLWRNLYKIEVMITSFLEILELTYFGHTTTYAVWVIWWNFVNDVIDKNYEAFQMTVILRRPGVVRFADIIKIAIMWTETTF